MKGLPRNVWLICIAATLVNGSVFLWDPFLPKHLESLGASILVIGTLFTLLELIGAFSHGIGGLWGDLFGRKNVFLICTISYLFAYLFLSLAPALFLAITLLLFLSIFRGASVTVVHTLIVDSSEEKRASGIAIHELLINLAAISFPLIGGYLVQEFGSLIGLRYCFFLTLILVLIGFAISLFLEETLGRMGNLLSEIKKIFSLLKEVPLSIAFLLAAYSTWHLAASIASPYYIFYALDRIGIQPFQYGAFMSIIAIFGSIAMIPGGGLSDRVGRKKFLIARYLIWIGFPLAFILARNFLHLILVAAIAGLSAIGRPSLTAFVADKVSLEKRSRVIGFLDMFADFFSIPGPAIGGLLYLTNSTFPFLAASLFGSVALLFILKIRE